MSDRKKGPLPAPENPYVGAMIKAARNGDVQASAMCLHLIGQNLLKHRSPDPALAQYVGERLTGTSIASLVAIRQADKKTTKERALEIARNLGLISPRRGPRTSRFKPVSHWFYLASLVVDFHEKKECPLTRNEDGAFFRAAKTIGCSPAKAEEAYRRLLTNEELLASAREGSALIYAEALRKLRKERSK